MSKYDFHALIRFKALKSQQDLVNMGLMVSLGSLV